LPSTSPPLLYDPAFETPAPECLLHNSPLQRYPCR
jgi:hypothetical protein